MPTQLESRIAALERCQVTHRDVPVFEMTPEDAARIFHEAMAKADAMPTDPRWVGLTGQQIASICRARIQGDMTADEALNAYGSQGARNYQGASH